jgi:ketosteroid isomerase-like protein
MRSRLRFHIIIILLVPLPVFAQKPGGGVALSVEHVLHQQQDAWNHHDLESFMAGYWNSPQLTFFSDAKASEGWQAALDHYRKTYQSEGKEMGHLDFSELRVQPLAPDAAFVRGAWRLTLANGKKPHGLFTLVFRRFPEGWKIIHDHTSASEP